MLKQRRFLNGSLRRSQRLPADHRTWRGSGVRPHILPSAAESTGAPGVSALTAASGMAAPGVFLLLAVSPNSQSKPSVTYRPPQPPALGLFVEWPISNLRMARQGYEEKSRPGATPNDFLMRLPAQHCSGSAASVPNPDAIRLTRG